MKELPQPARRQPWETKAVLGRSVLLAPALIVVLLGVGVPLVAMIWISLTGTLSFDPTKGFSLVTYREVLSSDLYLRAIGVTFEVSGLTLLSCVLIGTPFAIILAFSRGTLGTLLLLMVLLPFWTALLVRTYSLLVLLQRNGLINTALIEFGIVAEPLSLINNMFATVLGMSQIMMPVYILPVYAAVRQIDPNLIRAAASLGATQIRTILTVILPGAGGGIAAGSILVFVLSLGFYVTPAILGGGRIAMISNRIERSMFRLGDWQTAATLGVLLLVIVLAILVAGALIRRALVRAVEP
jgi:putative spermidine/putrescine transport system permease protein